ncbi:MAG: aspartate kinase [Bacteroidota bacterium]|nr:aspartate kinase [Bacteroidota bacterium]
MIIMKFGGTSTQDAAAMLNVTEIVKSHLHKHPFVVISAIAQATNQLEQMGNLAKSGDLEGGQVVLKNFVKRHLYIVNQAITDPVEKIAINTKINNIGEELAELIRRVAIIKELTPRILDKFYSYGELLSSMIVCHIMKEKGIDSLWIDTKDFMITDDNYNRALPVMESVHDKLISLTGDLLKEGKTLVTQGFIGFTLDGDRTTMGRESSDFSAAIIGSVLSAEDIQIWTDVDGILTGDPNIVENPKKIKVLSFEEAYELSLLGAKVLHPNTMLPALEKNIPIHVFNSKRPQISGTLVSNSANTFTPQNASVIKSVTYKTNINLINIRPKVRSTPFVFWEHIFNLFTKYKINPLLTSTSEFKFSAAFETKSNIDSLKHEIGEIGYFKIKEGLALISLVGSNVLHDYSLNEKIFSEFRRTKINFIAFGPSESSISFMIPVDHFKETVRRLHQIFFETQDDSNIFESLQAINIITPDKEA